MKYPKRIKTLQLLISRGFFWIFLWGFLAPQLQAVEYRFSQSRKETRLTFIAAKPIELHLANRSGTASRIFCQIESPPGEGQYQLDPWKRPAGSAIQDIHKVRFGDEMHITIHLYAKVPFKTYVNGRRLEILLSDSSYRDPLKQIFFKGVSLQNRNEFPHALERYQHVLKQDEKFAPAYYKAGQIRLEWRDFKRAEINLRRAQQLGCDSVGVHKALADLYREMGNEPRARRLYETYHERVKHRAHLDSISGFQRKGVASISAKIPDWAREENAGFLGISTSSLYKFLLLILAVLILKLGVELWRWRERRLALLYRRSFIPSKADYYDIPYDSLDHDRDYEDAEDEELQDGYYTVDEYDRRNSYWQDEELVETEVSQPESVQEESSQAELDADHLIRLLLQEEQRIEKSDPVVFPEKEELEQNRHLQQVLDLQRSGLTLPQIARRTGLGQEDILFLLWLEQQRILVYGDSE